MIELDQRSQQRDLDGRLRRGDLFDHAKPHLVLAQRHDLRQVRLPVVRQLVTLPDLRAQHLAEVIRIIVENIGLAPVNLFDKKPASCHGVRNKIMFAHLRGTLLEKHPNQAVVEAAGVGYDVTIAVPAFTKLPEPGNEVRLFIHTHVREDAIALFGFLTRDDKAMFERLISVSGIGPKLAITVLSGLAASDLADAIRRGAVERLVRVPGIGKKTAERMVLELRDKLPAPAGEAPQAESTAMGAIEQDVLSALVNLGCARPAAEAAVRKAKATEGEADFDRLFRRALELAR